MVLWIIANFKTGFLKNDKHKKGFIIHILSLQGVLEWHTKINDKVEIILFIQIEEIVDQKTIFLLIYAGNFVK